MDKVYLKKNGKDIGYIDLENKVYRTRRTKETYFYKFEGFGLSFSVIELLEQYDIEKIEFLIEGFVLETSLVQFYVHGENYIDKGDAQLILNKKYFKERESKEINVILRAFL